MKTFGLTPTEPMKTNFGIGNCSSVDVQALDGSFVGKLAFIQPGVYYSNTVIVGETTWADRVVNFVSNGTGNIKGFDYLDEVKIDFSGSKNYDQVWVAISENGGWNRWAGRWWVGSEIPSNKIISLSQLWADNHLGSTFAELPVTYNVQFVVKNTNCQNWNNTDLDFFVCPTGYGCRFGLEDVTTSLPISMATSGNRLKILNLDFKKEQHYSVTIYSVDGRKMLATNASAIPDIDISYFTPGMYVVRVTEKMNGTPIFTGKFVK